MWANHALSKLLYVYLTLEVKNQIRAKQNFAQSAKSQLLFKDFFEDLAGKQQIINIENEI